MPLRVSGKNMNIGAALRRAHHRPRRRSHIEVFPRRLFGPRDGRARTASDITPNSCCISIPARCLRPKAWRPMPTKAPTRQRSILKNVCAATSAAARIIKACAAVDINPELAGKNRSSYVGAPLTAGAEGTYGPPHSTNPRVYPRSFLRSLVMSMTLTDLVAPNAILPALKVNNKKQAIQGLAARAAELTGQSEKTILEILLAAGKAWLDRGG